VIIDGSAQKTVLKTDRFKDQKIGIENHGMGRDQP
jgi:hypothetical protein